METVTILKMRLFFSGRAPTLLARALVFTTCLTLAFSGVMLPGAVRAQTAFSLKDVPVPVPTAAVIVKTADPTPTTHDIAGPGTPLTFNPLISTPAAPTDIVKNQAALLQLGKALFWDMQTGSDATQACATCHYNAGADNRSKNQLNPGAADTNFGGDKTWGNSVSPFTANDPNAQGDPPGSNPPDPNFNVPGYPQFKPNYQMQATEFPLNKWLRPTELTPRGLQIAGFPDAGGFLQEFANVESDTNDVMGSQGVRNTAFTPTSITLGKALEKGTALPDIFNTKTPGTPDTASRVRRSTGRNAPTAINAVFNFDNFWDGRASFIFNGVNPFGFRDRASTLKLRMTGGAPDPAGTLTDVYVRITNSSLASQSVGPPGSDVEMSWAGRTFPDIGHKMLVLRPLAQQFVHPADSVLGPLSRGKSAAGGKVAGLKGLKTATYADMVKAAFQDAWWSDTTPFAPVPGTKVVQKASTNDPRNMVVSPGKFVPAKGNTAAAAANGAVSTQAGTYTQMEINFSLFWGLAVQAYEATLVSDDAPFDRFMGSAAAVDRNPLSPTYNQPGAAINPDPGAFGTDPAPLLGLTIFTNDPAGGGVAGRCVNCHILPIGTGMTVLDINPDAQGVPGGEVSEGQPGILETMTMGDGTSANYDHGMYNISVRRTTEDLGRNGTAGSFVNPLTGQGYPLSYTEMIALDFNGGGTSLLPPDVSRFIPKDPNTGNPIAVLDRRVTAGAFKVGNVRNTKYTGPYFHNGDSASLRQVVEFYIRGGNFPNTNFANLTVDIEGVVDLMFPEFEPSAKQNVDGLVAFLADGLADDRVALEKAPFDHPQLFVPTGAPTDKTPSKDKLLEIKATGSTGRPLLKGQPNPIPTFLNMDPNTPG